MSKIALARSGVDTLLKGLSDGEWESEWFGGVLESCGVGFREAEFMDGWGIGSKTRRSLNILLSFGSPDCGKSGERSRATLRHGRDRFSGPQRCHSVGSGLGFNLCVAPSP